jgi:hypothetical protein
LSVALLQHINNSSHKEDSEDKQPRIGVGVNSLLVVMLNYVFVEAEQGVIKEYITIQAEY